MLISVDFWKSMHGFAMDSRTRERKTEEVKNAFIKLRVQDLNYNHLNDTRLRVPA